MEITFFLLAMLMSIGVCAVRPRRDGSETNQAVAVLAVAIMLLVLGAMVPA
jgi:low affinity Fe/Cu permease